MFDSWLTLSGAASGFDLRGALRDPDAPGSGHGWGRPAKFATYRDPQGRFELGYPTGWDLEAGEGVHVRSKHLSSFAQVDILPASPGVWESLQAAVAKAAGSLTILKDIPGEIRQLRGRLEFQGIHFDVHAWAYPRGNETIVLTTGSVVDSDSSAPWKLYQEQVLSAIHRAFRVPG
jgi:hypothetical protein